MSDISQAHLENLKQRISELNNAYYVLDNPLVSDAQYDELYKQLLEIEKLHPEWITSDSPTQRVGDKPLSHFESVAHAVPMFSHDNVLQSGRFNRFPKKS